MTQPVCTCQHAHAMHGEKTGACFVPVASGGAAIGVIWCTCTSYAAADSKPGKVDDLT